MKAVKLTLIAFLTLLFVQLGYAIQRDSLLYAVKKSSGKISFFTKRIKVVLDDGSKLVGRYKILNDSTIVLISRSGNIPVPLSKIRKIKSRSVWPKILPVAAILGAWALTVYVFKIDEHYFYRRNHKFVEAMYLLALYGLTSPIRFGWAKSRKKYDFKVSPMTVEIFKQASKRAIGRMLLSIAFAIPAAIWVNNSENMYIYMLGFASLYEAFIKYLQYYPASWKLLRQAKRANLRTGYIWFVYINLFVGTLILAFAILVGLVIIGLALSGGLLGL